MLLVDVEIHPFSLYSPPLTIVWPTAYGYGNAHESSPPAISIEFPLACNLSA